MSNISEITFTHLTTRHSYKETVLAFYDLDVVDYEFFIKRYRYDCLHFPFVSDFSDPYVGNLHVSFHLSYTSTFLVILSITYKLLFCNKYFKL